MPYRVALVGAGRMGQGYLDVYTGFANCELVALVEPNAERAAGCCRTEVRRGRALCNH